MKENEGFFIFLFIVLTWYMAAMYRIPSLMALSLAELFMVFLLFLSARYFRRNFQAGFCEKQEVVRKKGKISVRIWTENHAFLPLGRYRIQLFSSYEKFQKGRFFTYDGSIDSKKREEEELVLEAPWCGKLYVSMIYRQTYDYLSLFKTRAKSFCEEEIAVLPSGFPLTVRLSSSAAWENRGYEEDAAPQAGGSGGEIRQLREYVPGDLVRRIHWNQSARTDRLLVKEFQKEEEESVSLYLDFSGEEEPRAKEWGAFYQILSGLILGLLKEKAAVQVSWEDSRGQTSYTRSPGMFPLNEEPTEYFLFQGKEGYCQHFASAAVLMYRIYGIPARYATGYAVSPADFEEQPDGTYRAVVTDESAHAWPEVFIHDYGWTPVEVTPLENGAGTNYPGFDSETFQNIMTENDWDISLPSLQTGDSQEREEDRKEESESFSLEADWKLIARCAGPGAAVLTAFCILLYVRYKKRDQWIREGGMGRLFDLHFSGSMEKYQGWEKDFPYMLAKEIPIISKEEAGQILETAQEAAFGNPVEVPEKNYQAAYESCLKIRNFAVSEMSRGKRLFYYMRISFRWFSL